MFSRKNFVALIVTIGACLMIAPVAGAAITAAPYGGTTDATVGGHGDLTTGVTFNYGSSTTDSVKRILVDLPAGGALDLTVGEDLTSDGTSILGKGVKPDVRTSSAAARADSDAGVERALSVVGQQLPPGGP